MQYLLVMMRTPLKSLVRNLQLEAGKGHHNLLGRPMMLLKSLRLLLEEGAEEGEGVEAVIV